MRAILQVFILLIFCACGARKDIVEIKQIQLIRPYEQVLNKRTLNLDELKDIPKEIDLSEKMTSVKDQGDRGTCSYFAALGLIESAIKVKTNQEVNLSEEYLINLMKNEVSFGNKDYGSTLQNLDYMINNNRPFIVEEAWPYQPSWFKIKSPCKKFGPNDKNAPSICYSHNRPQITKNNILVSGNKFNLSKHYPRSTNEIIYLIVNEKNPITIELPFHPNGWDLTGHVRFTKEMYNDCKNNPERCGLHSVILTGFNIDKKVFYFKNSWGTSWGNKGFGEVEMDVVDLYTKHQFFRVSLIDNHKIHFEDNKSLNTTTISDVHVEAIVNNNLDLEFETLFRIENANSNNFVFEVVLMKKIGKMKSNVVLNIEDIYQFSVLEISEKFYLFSDDPTFEQYKKRQSSFSFKMSEKFKQIPTFSKLLKEESEKVLIDFKVFKKSDIGLIQVYQEEISLKKSNI